MPCLKLPSSPFFVDERWVNQIIIYCEDEHTFSLIAETHVPEAMAN